MIKNGSTLVANKIKAKTFDAKIIQKLDDEGNFLLITFMDSEDNLGVVTGGDRSANGLKTNVEDVGATEEIVSLRSGTIEAEGNFINL